ncbi:MAG: VWA domain-containing protein, partial [Propionibacteriaceae bacterium]|nr:VWA domain-containing protein [Propionibacteriaceae bacterium]
ARFALVGTMNPEEGALRPQLLDRFGLCVTTDGIPDVAERVEVLSRRLAFDADPGGFTAGWNGAEQGVAARLSQARAAAPSVQVGPDLTEQITRLAIDAQVAGHRADLVMTRATRAHAAWCGRTAAVLADLDAVAELVLTHRRRHLEPPEPPQVAAAPQPPDAASTATSADDSPADRPAGEPPAEEIFGIGETFGVHPLNVGASRRSQASSGRRTTTVATHDRGRYVRSRATQEPRDLALDATLRASAVHQRQRRQRAEERGDPRAGLAILIEPTDWRRKVRARQVGSLVVLCVDASGSMGARNRMVASKGAVLSLLLDAYVKRDQVSLVSFRGPDAEVLVPPTSSIDTAERRLRDLAVGGRTPLAAGLVAVGQVVRRALAKDPALRPLVIVITDGRGNVTLAGQVSRTAGPETLEVAAQLARDERVTWVVVDSNATGLASRGHSDELAYALGAPRFTIHDLRAEDLVSMVHHASGKERR